MNPKTNMSNNVSIIEKRNELPFIFSQSMKPKRKSEVLRRQYPFGSTLPYYRKINNLQLYTSNDKLGDIRPK